MTWIEGNLHPTKKRKRSGNGETKWEREASLKRGGGVLPNGTPVRGERGGTLFREYHDNGSSPRARFIKKRALSLPSFSQLLWGLVVVWSECASEWDTVLRATRHSCPRHAHKCGSRMETNIYIYAHTKTHWLWFHLEDPLGVHVQRARGI